MDDALALARLRRRTLGRYRYARPRWRILFAIIDTVGRLIFAPARAARKLLPRTYRYRVPSDPKRILLVQLDHLGDAIITTAMLPALRRRYPSASVEVLASPWNREVFEEAAEVDRVYVSNNNRFSGVVRKSASPGESRRSRLPSGTCEPGRFSRTGSFAWPLAMVGWGLWLRRRRYDLAIDVRGEFPLALLLWLSGARQRVGWDCGGGGFLLTHRPLYVPGRAEIKSRLALLAELGTASAADEPRRPFFVPSSKAKQTASQLWKSLAKSPGDRPVRIVLHVGAGTSAKSWPAEHWRTLLRRIVSRGNVQVVLVGARSEQGIARQIAGRTSAREVADWTGRLDIAELAAVVQDANLFVGADSGPAHLAAAVGTPVVALFSGTNLARQWQPTGRRVVVLRKPVACSPCHREECPVPGHPCMQGLTPVRVAEQIYLLLDEQTTTHEAATAETGRAVERGRMR